MPPPRAPRVPTFVVKLSVRVLGSERSSSVSRRRNLRASFCFRVMGGLLGKWGGRTRSRRGRRATMGLLGGDQRGKGLVVPRERAFWVANCLSSRGPPAPT